MVTGSLPGSKGIAAWGVPIMSATVRFISDSVEAGETMKGGSLLTGVASKGRLCWIGDDGSAIESVSAASPRGDGAVAILGPEGAARPKSS